MKPSEESDITASDSIFETEIQANVSRSERFKRFINEYIIASLQIMWESWQARVGGAILVFFLFVGTVGVWIIDVPRSGEGPRLAPPFQSLEYPLGTDTIGMGLMSQLVHATPAMLIMIASGAVFTTVLATILGTYAGYKGGFIDRVLMTIADTAVSIPGLPLVIVLGFLLEPRNPVFVGIVVTINAWAGLARSIRAQVLTLREESYVEASRVMGISTPAIIVKDLLPNIMPYILVNFTISGRRVIVASVALYFLGVLPVTTFNWGFTLNQAYGGSGLYSLDSVHWVIFPMLTIVIFTYGLILFGQGADQVFNPQARLRHVDQESEEKTDQLS